MAAEPPVALRRCLVAEGLGTGLLVAIVVGSGIFAARLSPGDEGLQLLENSTATALGLMALILAFGPVSGAHFNPVVTLADRRLGGISTGRAADVVVTMGCGDACPYYPGTRYEDWALDDPHGQGPGRRPDRSVTRSNAGSGDFSTTSGEPVT